MKDLEPDPASAGIQGFKGSDDKHYKHLPAGLDEVKCNFAAYVRLTTNEISRGWFKDTLPTAPIESIAVLRLDGDYYESTRDALTNLYDKVSVGGYVIIDDYGEDSWTSCRKAVDEFRAERGITDTMVRIDKPCSFWQKTRGKDIAALPGR